MYNFLKLNLARNALRYIIRTYDIKEMYIPYYLCGVVKQALMKEKCKPLFYHIDGEFMPAQEFPLDTYILYPNYFGVCDKNVSALCAKYPFLIIDNAHSFYDEPKGFACFNSARKFLPVYNGSYLWIKDKKFKMPKEQNYNFAPVTEEELYKNERDFDGAEIKQLHDLTVQEIKKFDNNNERKENFIGLHKKYGEINLLNIDEKPISPFCYPCLFTTEVEADEFVSKLKSKGIKIYRYWEKLPEDFPEYRFFSCLVAIPLSKEL